MMNQISSRDWEALSAYLDGQLTQKDRLRLEQKLQTSSDLRLALEELSRTRTILRSQPGLRAPRSFTLTPEMVGMRRERRSEARLYPAFSFVSALASLLFVVVLLGSFLIRGSNQASLAPAAESAQSAPAILSTEPLSEQPAPLMAQRTSQQANESAADQATEKTFSAQLAPEGTPTGQPTMGLGAGQPLQSPTPEAPPAVAAAPKVGPSSTQSDQFESPYEPPAAALSQSTSPAQPAYPASPETQETPHVNINPSVWPILEGLLAFIAIGSGLLAFYLRRTMR